MELQAHPDLTPSVIMGLGWLYLLLFAMNLAWAYTSFKGGRHFRTRLGGLLSSPQDIPTATFWAVYSAL